MQSLGPCSWRYVLNMDDLARYRLKTRSDVMSTWSIQATTINNFYCQVKLEITTQCFTPTLSRSGASYRAEKSDKNDSTQVRHQRTLLLPAHLTGLTTFQVWALKKDHSSARGASRAYRESQSRIYKLEAPLYVGVGEGTDSLDFHADLSALKAIHPDEVASAQPMESQPVPRSDSPLLQKLRQEEIPYAYCAWCEASLPTRSKLEDHYYSEHHVVLQPSCCAPPSVFQTIMGKELQLRQRNFASFGVEDRRLFLRPQMHPDDARDILGATCSVLEDKTRIWHMKMPALFQVDGNLPDISTPALHWLSDEEADLNDYLHDPTNPVLCLPSQHEMAVLAAQNDISGVRARGARVYPELLAAVPGFTEVDLRDKDAFYSSISIYAK